MSVSPADFELYSRATGAPLPRTAQEQMQMAPQVHQFIQARGYQRPKGFLGEVGGYLKNAALLGGGLALANYLSSNNDDSDDGIRVDLASPGSVDASVVPQRVITGATDGIGNQPSPAPTPTPQTPVVRENVGTLGSITRPLGVQVSDPWGMDKGPPEVVAPSRGFGPAPAPRAEADGLRDIEFSMKPPIQRDPSFFNPTGNWGVGDTANLAGSAINFAMDYGPTIAEQGALDIGRGVRDIKKGIDDTSVVINSFYDAGAATRQLLDSTIASLPTSSFQQSAPLETDDQSILFDHPDVVQSGTGSDEVQSNRNYIAQGNVDLEGKPITVGEFDSAYPAETYTDYRKFGVGGGGVNYLSAGNRYDGDPEMVGKVPSQRTKEAFISSAGIPQIKEELVGGEIAESAPPEAENFHILKQFVRGLTGQDSPVDYTTEPSRQDLLNDPNASKEDLLNEMNRRVEGEMAQDGPNKAAYDAKQRLAKKTQMMQDLSALVGEVQSNQSVNDGYEAYQEFEPKKSKTGGGSGVKSLAYDNQGQVVVDYWDRNPEKQTPGGYVSDSYQGAITGDKRDELVTNTANPSLMSGNMTQEQMDDYQSLVADEMEAEDTYQAGLRGSRFGRGEGQVSAGKFANKIKQNQQSAIEFLKENSDKLRGI